MITVKDINGDFDMEYHFQISPFSDVVYEEGDFAVFELSPDKTETYPFSVVDRSFNKQKFIIEHQIEHGEKIIAYIVKINVGKNGKPYCILYPTVPLRWLNKLGTTDPCILSERITAWKKKRSRPLDSVIYTSKQSEFQSLAYIIHSLLYNSKLSGGMTLEEIIEASQDHAIYADRDVHLLDAEFFDGWIFDLNQGDGSRHFYISYDGRDSEDIDEVTLVDLIKFSINEQLENVSVTQNRSLVQINLLPNQSKKVG